MGNPIHINFSDVPESFEPLPAGVYPCVIETIEEKESQSSDYPYLNWTLAVAGEEHVGRKLWFMTSLSPKALWKLRDTLLDLGLSKEDVQSADFEFRADDWLNVQVMATVIQEPYQGKIQNRVEGIATGGETTKATPGAKAGAKAGDKTTAAGSKKRI